MDFTSDQRSVAELIADVIEKVRNAYYWEDGGFVDDWLRDDIQHIADKAAMETYLELDELTKKKPNVTFYRTSVHELEDEDEARLKGEL